MIQRPVIDPFYFFYCSDSVYDHFVIEWFELLSGILPATSDIYPLFIMNIYHIRLLQICSSKRYYLIFFRGRPSKSAYMCVYLDKQIHLAVLFGMLYFVLCIYSIGCLLSEFWFHSLIDDFCCDVFYFLCWYILLFAILAFTIGCTFLQRVFWIIADIEYGCEGSIMCSILLIGFY